MKIHLPDYINLHSSKPISSVSLTHLRISPYLNVRSNVALSTSPISCQKNVPLSSLTHPAPFNKLRSKAMITLHFFILLPCSPLSQSFASPTSQMPPKHYSLSPSIATQALSLERPSSGNTPESNRKTRCEPMSCLADIDPQLLEADR